ncbi:hypothetical protein WICMUC_005610 [Wickerhamomyces mucosus]|uniref:Glycine cleavage system H protein n=1 Tax=Wickerhamomyces mucosus TaxID=1378264 RepID=A0A9P8P7Q5_9ASCO|nr:hypothetical protein WICMUC_005610 [Wickerhamomyces mucosus]
MFLRTVTQCSRQPLRLALRSISTSASHIITPNSIITKYSAGPITVRYTSEHEYIAQHPDGVAFIGITKYASDALGDATFVELPEVGDEVLKGESIGSVESVKSSSEIYSPVDGEILEINETLTDSPQLINEDPLGEGWLAKIKTDIKIESVEDLLTEEDYAKSLEAEEN